MIKKILSTAALLVTTIASAQWAPIQRANEYQISIDINAYQDDQLPIELVPPLVEADTVFYIMPKVVPGTYDISDFGRFVNEFKALNSRGEELPVERLDNNKWQIAKANELYKIQYKVDDSFDHPVAGLEIFRPGGTSFKEGIFLFNMFGMLGYLEGAKNVPFSLEVNKPDWLYGASALKLEERTETKDLFSARTYFELHDRPIMYSKPDTASTMIGQTKVTVAVYSASNSYNSEGAMQASAPVLKAIGDYLGGELPTDQYVILVYADEPDPSIAGYGALEHQTSTVLYMPEFESELMNEEVRDIVAHEFLHIVTPLAIHSKEINDFDFYDPEMSKHLWLYEGVTEYTSLLVQVQAGLITPQEFVDEMEGKMDQSDAYNDRIPMTVMSENVLEIFKEDYHNVYQKGALIGMCLDLHLRVKSDGEIGLVDLMNDLGSHFGPDTFFVDNSLFDYLSDRWGYDLKAFFALYVEGAEPLPFTELLEEVGILYQETHVVDQIGFGDLPLAYDPDQELLFIYDASSLSPMGEEMGIQSDDRILELNGQMVNVETARDIFSDFYANTEEGDKVKMVVLRQVDGEWKKKKLKCKAEPYPVEYRHLVRMDESPTTQQAKIRGSWLKQ